MEVGRTSPEVVVEDLEQQDFVKYAGASGDLNPVHYDEPYARVLGNPSVFGQGIFTAGVTMHWLLIGSVSVTSNRSGHVSHHASG
ncbi:MaoC/PaaZ C-terminal domain-containing protein [Halorarius halobius]|uniref:MaoC/PaaZ C-terminal domain-containing protein n=1 Tax=Halorarius halobius TaxID=2962671 RepID=UPI00331387F1